MTAETLDISDFIKTRSNQLNADDLIGGDITVRIEGVRKSGSAEQPIVITISGGHLPWKPSKTALRVLAYAWGKNALKWAGKWARLYRDEKVRWAGEEVGGIRIRALSHIKEPISLALNESNKKKKVEHVAVLSDRDLVQAGEPTANLDALLAEEGLTPDDVDRWLAGNGKPPLADRNAGQRARLAAHLAENPAALDAIRALKHDDAGDGRTGGEE
jgi:hypothetical protein